NQTGHRGTLPRSPARVAALGTSPYNDRASAISRRVVLTFRLRSLLVCVLLLTLAVAGLSAQEKVPIGDSPPPAPPAAPATVPITAPAGAGTVVVSPGPEPWYTVFGTGAVVGFIEPWG